MMEFTIDENISLKLKGTMTHIYIKGVKFMQCKRLVLQIPISEDINHEEINSIDEAAEAYETLLENEIVESSRENIEISPEQEFWGHCSNLQTWVENDYDTRLLHSNLSFPLLKKLIEVGDLKVKKVFKEEIAKRIRVHHYATMEFFKEERYFNYLTREELYHALLIEKEASIVLELERALKMEFEPMVSIKVHERKVYFLEIHDKGLQKFPELIMELDGLLTLDLGKNKIRTVPATICKLRHLETLYLHHNEISVFPRTILGLKHLENLYLSWNVIKGIPKEIGQLKNLERLYLESNNLESIPKEITEIGSLNRLILKNNNFQKFPMEVLDIRFLSLLDLTENPIQGEIPSLDKTINLHLQI